MSTNAPNNYGPKFGTGVTKAKVAEYHAKGLNGAEIARILNISREAVRQHLKRLAEDAEKSA